MTTVLAVCAGLCAIPAGAEEMQQPGSAIGDALSGRMAPQPERQPSPPPVARYVAENGPTFVLDRSRPTGILLRFENSPEVWVLQQRPAPQGDVIYYNDLQRPVLRVPRIGGLILYTPANPGGLPAMMSGVAQPIPIRTIMEMREFERRMDAIGERIGKSVPIFDLHFVAERDYAGLVLDTGIALAAAFEDMAARGGKPLLGKLRRISIVPGERASVSMDGTTLKVVIAPKMGIAGRPSSERIVQSVAFNGSQAPSPQGQARSR